MQSGKKLVCSDPYVQPGRQQQCRGASLWTMTRHFSQPLSHSGLSFMRAPSQPQVQKTLHMYLQRLGSAWNGSRIVTAFIGLLCTAPVTHRYPSDPRCQPHTISPRFHSFPCLCKTNPTIAVHAVSHRSSGLPYVQNLLKQEHTTARPQ